MPHAAGDKGTVPVLEVLLLLHIIMKEERVCAWGCPVRGMHTRYVHLCQSVTCTM